jgi:hypothetical protein
MTSTRFCATLAIAVLILGYVISRMPQQSVAAEPAVTVSIPENDPRYESTAIGVVLRANCNEVPRNGEELVRVLEHLGEFAQLPIPFSAVALDSGLLTPRVIIAPVPARAPAKPNPSVTDFDMGGLGGFGLPIGNPVQPKQPRGPAVFQTGTSPISVLGADQPNLEGRLFLAANMEKNGKDIHVKTVEFISWNSRKKRFDFGVIDYRSGQPEIAFLDGVRCFSCHKNRGPIMGNGPWSNTMHNDVVNAAATQLLMNQGLFQRPNQQAKGQFVNHRLVAKQMNRFDGMALLFSQPDAVDAAVRQGSDLVRDRAVYKAMLKTADGRKAFNYLLLAIADPQPIDAAYQEVKPSIDRAYSVTSGNFANEFVSIHKNSPSTLVDFNPAGSMGVLRTFSGGVSSWGSGSSQPPMTMLVFTGDPEKVITYDTHRTSGEHGMPTSKQPSNPRAFMRTPAPVPPRPSAAISAAGLARTIGLTEGDRAFMARTLSDAAQRINQPKVTPAALAREVFASPRFTEQFNSGDIPDREDFKERFVTAIKDILRAHRIYDGLTLDRRIYASSSNLSPPSTKEEPEPELVPTTACLRCHDVRGIGKPAFNPIPQLAFDPFDKKSRENWLSSTNAKQKQQVLERMLKRLATDRDMPPEDSAEHDLFRVKEAASFAAVKDLLEAELQKVK